MGLTSHVDRASFHVAELDCAEEAAVLRRTLENQPGIVDLGFDYTDIGTLIGLFMVPGAFLTIAAGYADPASAAQAVYAFEHKVAELDAANQEFQAKCSTLQPARAQTASANLPPNVSIVSGPAPGAATAQTAARTAAAAKTAAKAATSPVVPATTD